MQKKDEKLTPSNPRLQGIEEQYKRAERFVRLAKRCKKPAFQFRNLIAAVYPARAIIELMLEAAEEQELVSFKNKDAKKSRMEFEAELIPRLPYYSLIENIRIHDFHRFGCLPPLENSNMTFLGGPIKLVAKKGSAAVLFTPRGPALKKTGNSLIKPHRPLCTANGLFFDEESEEYVPLGRVFGDYLSAVRDVINDFIKMVG